jgi:hypothetical protein
MTVRNGSIRDRDKAPRSIVSIILLLAILCSGCVPPGGISRSSGSSASTDDSLSTPELTRALGARIYPAGNESAPPVLRLSEPGKPPTSEALTLTFEMVASAMPSPTLILVHCDALWRPTESIFIQDNFKLRSSDFKIEHSPISARFYDFRLSITFPAPDLRIEILHSGNYLARVVDYYDNSKIYCETRFFVIEQKSTVDMDVYSDFYESSQTKVLNHGLKARVEAQPSGDLFAARPRGIHLYRSGEWYSPIMAGDESLMKEASPGEPRTTWNAYFGGKAIAQFSNIPAGNEHRLLDLTDILQYPPTNGPLSTPLSDLPRGGSAPPDNNGMVGSRFVSTTDDDYVVFEFRLDLAGYESKQDIFVVGTFNDWRATPEWQLHFDKASGFYVARGLIRRAFHEYQYLSGEWDDDAKVLRHADPTLLEGNSTYATSLFYSFVYYHDPTSGGYDRLIGAGAAWSGTGQ